MAEPSTFERVIRAVREVMLIAWLLLGCVLMVLLLSGLASFADRLSRLDAPTPAPTPTATVCVGEESC